MSLQNLSHKWEDETGNYSVNWSPITGLIIMRVYPNTEDPRICKVLMKAFDLSKSFDATDLVIKTINEFRSES